MKKARRKRKPSEGAEFRRRLLYGPYRPPQVRLGGELFCSIRGSVTFRKLSEGPIPWPCTGGGGGKRGKGSIVLCGDLVRAVKAESSLAIQYWWGVSVATVLRWRAALEVEQFNEGTRELYRQNVPRIFTREKTKLGHRLAATPQVRAKALETWRSRGIASEIRWTDEQDALLGTMPDQEVALRMGCSDGAVRRRRCRLGMAAFRSHLRRYPDLHVLSPAKLLARRLELNLLQKQVAAAAGVATHTYSEIEGGFRHSVRLATLDGLARALKCPASTIVA